MTNDSGLAELADLLWRERAAVERVLFKVDQQRLVLTAGRTRWLAESARELAAAVDELRAGEVVRAAAADAVARSLGLDAGASLGELSEAAPPPWDELLRDHHEALRELVSEINASTSATRPFLARGVSAVREIVRSVPAETPPES